MSKACLSLAELRPSHDFYIPLALSHINILSIYGPCLVVRAQLSTSVRGNVSKDSVFGNMTPRIPETLDVRRWECVQR